MSDFTSAPMHTSMRRNGKSFWFASRFLARQTAADAGILYAFCRTMDDLADESRDSGAVNRLRQTRIDLERGQSGEPGTAAFLQLASCRQLPLEVADHLIQSFLCDVETPLQIGTEEDLIRYCFGVAGTVGLLMSPILGAVDREARRHAIDLGIAMQMTNIARDVLEDARNGRRYLPGSWLGDLTPQQIASQETARPAVSVAIGRLLLLADAFYSSARLGFAFIPAPNRTAIQVAASVYREIGVQLQERQLQWWGARCVISMPRKVLLATSVLRGRAPLDHLHVSLPLGMHPALAGLPGTA